MSKNEVKELAKRAQLANTGYSRDKCVEQLLKRGGFLLIESGLVSDPEISNGTVFSLGGLEYVVNSQGSHVLSTKTGTALIDVVGGGRPKLFTYRTLIKAIYNSADFDQLAPRDS